MTEQEKMDSRLGVSDLLEIMKTLRHPEKGCPWDLEQSYRSIVSHTLEEAYEVADTIERGDLEALRDELGDLLFQVVFYAQIASEENRFDFDDVVDRIGQKLIRRHPHVFGEHQVADVVEQTQLWESLKQQEKGADSAVDGSILDGVLHSLPALTRAAKIQRKAALHGFDWPNLDGVLDKVEEELVELKEALLSEPSARDRIEEEMGDLLFSMVNLCRHLNLDGEGVLRRATVKFESRFRWMEGQINRQGNTLQELEITEMEAVWQQAKQALEQ